MFKEEYKEDIEKLNDCLSNENLYQLVNDDFGIKVRLNHFSVTFEYFINILNGIIKEKFNDNLDSKDQKNLIIQQSLDTNIIKDETIWSKFLDIYNKFIEYQKNNSFIGEFENDSDRNYFTDSMKFVNDNYIELKKFVESLEI